MARKRIGDLLVEAGLLTPEKLQQALQEQKQGKEKLGDLLISKGYITEQQLIEVLEFQLGIPHVQLSRYKIEPSIANIIPERLANMYQVIPIRKESNKLIVAMKDPLDYYAIDDLRMSTGFLIEPVIASKDDVQRAINRYYSMQESLQEMIQTTQQTDTLQDTEAANDDSPVVRTVNQLIIQAVQMRASDIHIDPQSDSVRIRYRIDGILRTEQELPKHLQSVISARIKVLSSLNLSERRLPQDGRFQMEVDFRTIDLRVSTLPTAHGEKIVLRILDVKHAINQLEQLGFHEGNLQSFRKLLANSHGMLLITGPTGSGKTSTLYAGLTQLNHEDVNIITVEDPIEYQMDGINQVQVNVQTGMTFAKGLRAILRQDPNIVMVGEIRDLETAEIAVRAALTGHLVLSTLHTNDAVSTITRLIDMGIEPFMVASSLSGVVAQRLVRKICPECAARYTPKQEELEILKAYGLAADGMRIGRGCSTCNRTGFRGRMAIHEVFAMDDVLRRLVMQRQSDAVYREHVTQHGMHTMFHDGLIKVSQGLTTMTEIYRVTTME
ncbi:GspE/PulE family protein [Fodinisporobacter ferrooxydans]|uniref:GspE/PulE family protein n=1 Tax=Fodinisporobacter ferrooxydans TaxID=2901836 RepID=A0ABY4CLP3_9BACL|nr:GspE/PulE family protein [Alicyclobacillaceae bacterium MYW30-H2]